MKHKKTIMALALFALVASLPLVTAQGNGMQYQHSQGMVELSTDDISIKVTAMNQVPHFHWWNNTDSGADYHVMFLKLFEATDNNTDGAYDPENDSIVGAPFALPSSGWDFSGFETEEDGSGNVTAVHFNFTNTATFSTPVDTPGPDRPDFDTTIQIRVHMDMDNPDQMKFDLIIDGWEWAEEDSLLVFQFTVSESNRGEVNGTREPSDFAQEGNQFEFGGAFMEYAEEASAGEHQVQVRGTHGEGPAQQEGKSVYLAFEYFGNETLEYDPTIGVASIGDGDTGLGIDYTQLLLIAGGITIVVLVIVAFKLRG
ncbi:MAG: hypothetical protein R6V83_09200 [Candidatus Thorarchaeota archaeon]